jgi:hypothetical protein
MHKLSVINLSTCLALLNRSTFLADFDKRSDLTDATLAKQAAKRNKPNQLHQSYSDFLSSKHPDRTLNSLHHENHSYLTNLTIDRTQLMQP